MKTIDLRSDTVTQPTDKMRNAMHYAIVGDDIYEDDPTVKELEKLAAEVMGKEAGLFMNSGTMGNLVACMVHTNHGEEAIMSSSSHIFVHEVGGISALCGVMPRLLHHPKDWVIAEEVVKNIRPDDIHEPKTTLVCLENALGNGTVVPLEEMKKTYETSKKHNLNVHLDGARIFNAATHLGCDPKDIAQYADSIMFCLSKGLCSPVGSMLVGSKEFISKARRKRKLIGGGLRQSGHLAACGLISINEMSKRLKEDHDNAKYLAEKLSEVKGISLNKDDVQINMVFFTFDEDENKFMRNLKKHDIKMNPSTDGVYRIVTHNDISKADIDKFVDVVLETVNE